MKTSPFQKILSGCYEPINRQARRGLNKGHPTPRPIGGIKREPALSKEFFKKKPSIMSRQEFRERHGLENADAKRKYGDYLKIFGKRPGVKNSPANTNLNPAVIVWDAKAEAEVKRIIGLGASVSKALARAAPPGFIAGLRDARNASLQAKTSQLLGGFTAGTVWNAEAEAKVRAIVASGASVPKALFKAAPIGFVAGLRAARKRGAA
jgi:hypothetical protein